MDSSHLQPPTDPLRTHDHAAPAGGGHDDHGGTSGGNEHSWVGRIFMGLVLLLIACVVVG